MILPHRFPIFYPTSFFLPFLNDHKSQLDINDECLKNNIKLKFNDQLGS
jgi:hypothetical protein